MGAGSGSGSGSGTGGIGSGSGAGTSALATALIGSMLAGYPLGARLNIATRETDVKENLWAPRTLSAT
jgi:hypothetical protein